MQVQARRRAPAAQRRRPARRSPEGTRHVSAESETPASRAGSATCQREAEHPNLRLVRSGSQAGGATWSNGTEAPCWRRLAEGGPRGAGVAVQQHGAWDVWRELSCECLVGSLVVVIVRRRSTDVRWATRKASSCSPACCRCYQRARSVAGEERSVQSARRRDVRSCWQEQPLSLCSAVQRKVHAVVALATKACVRCSTGTAHG